METGQDISYECEKWIWASCLPLYTSHMTLQPPGELCCLQRHLLLFLLEMAGHGPLCLKHASLNPLPQPLVPGLLGSPASTGALGQHPLLVFGFSKIILKNYLFNICLVKPTQSSLGARLPSSVLSTGLVEGLNLPCSVRIGWMKKLLNVGE